MRTGLALHCAVLALDSLALVSVYLAALWARDPELAPNLFIELRLPRTVLALLTVAGVG